MTKITPQRVSEFGTPVKNVEIATGRNACLRCVTGYVEYQGHHVGGQMYRCLQCGNDLQDQLQDTDLNVMEKYLS